MLSSIRTRLLAHSRHQLRTIYTTQTLLGAQTAVASLLSASDVVPTVDHLMPVERAAELMAESLVDAIPVTKDAKVVGVFTERDYFTKVLSHAKPNLTPTSPVAKVATMDEELVVAYPEDTVEQCLAVMTKKSLLALPVIHSRDGHILGTVTMPDLARELMEDRQIKATGTEGSDMFFSEPPHFPENTILPTGAIHDEINHANAKLHELKNQVKNGLSNASNASKATVASAALNAPERSALDPKYEEMAAQSFSESSVFPEYTPAEDRFLGKHTNSTDVQSTSAIAVEPDRFTAAESEVLDTVKRFSEPSDFPDGTPIEEACQAQKA